MSKHLQDVVSMLFKKRPVKVGKYNADVARWAKCEYGRDWEYNYHRLLAETKK